MSDTIAVKLEKIINIIIKGTIFLLPLFFLPWTSEHFEFNKQFLLWLLAPLALLLWFCKVAAAGQAKIKINLLNLPVGLFLLLTAAAAVFGLDRFSSFFGQVGRFSDSWLGLLSLVIFYFLIINTGAADSAKKIIGLLRLLLYSSLIVACWSLAARLGWLGAASASLFSLAVLLSIMSVAAAGFLLNGGLRKFDQIVFSVSLVMFLIILTLIDFSLSWVSLLLGAGLIIIFRWLAAGLSFKKILNYYLLIPAVVIFMAVLMLALPGINLAKPILGRELPKEALLGYGQSWIITKETFEKYPALGSGPGTFAEDFSLFRPAEFNSSAFWQIRFDKSRSHILEMLATAGLLTFLAYFLVICLVFYLNIVLIKKYLAKRQAEGAAADENYNLMGILFTIFILLFFSQLFFLTNTVLNFTFWFTLGLIMAFWQSSHQPLFKEKIIDLHQTVLFYRLFILILFILSAGIFTLLAFEVKFFAADLIAARGSDSETSLMTAIRLNPYRYNYRLSLAKLYLNQARTEALKPSGQIDNVKIQDSITRAIGMARSALALAPNSVLPKETLAMIYRDIKPLTIGSEPWAARYFSGALDLEPTNPVLATELAKQYLNFNDLVNAEKYFNKALELKADYYEAKFGLVKIYLSGKKDNQALVLLNELASQVYDEEVYYELGRYYYNHGEIDKAIDRFKLVLSMAPRQANSLYSLAVAYEAKGDTKEALKYYQQVLELDQGNQEVEKKIKELSK